MAFFPLQRNKKSNFTQTYILKTSERASKIDLKLLICDTFEMTLGIIILITQILIYFYYTCQKKVSGKQYNMLSKCHLFTYPKPHNESDHTDAVVEG